MKSLRPFARTEKRTSAPVLSGGTGSPGSELIVNPQPGYKLDKNGWGPRLSVDWRVASNTTMHIGGAITTLLVNLWQDNSLTGSTPFVVYPRLTAAPGQSIRYGMTITPQQLPSVYTPDGNLVFASGDSKQVAPNTPMDVLRFEQDLAALSPDHQITPLAVAGIAPNFSGGYVGTWTAGIEHKVRGVTLNGAYVGTAGIKLPSVDFPNGFHRSGPRLRALHAVRFIGPCDRRVRAGHRNNQPLALHLPCPATVRAEQPDRVRPRVSGQLHVLEISRRLERRGWRLHRRILGRRRPDRTDESVRSGRGQRAVRFRYQECVHLQSFPGSSCGFAGPSAAFGQDAHPRLAIAGYRDSPQRPPLHRLFGCAANRSRGGRHRPARSDRSPRPLDQPHHPRRLFRVGSRQRLALLTFRSMCPAEPDRITGASARSAETRFADRGCGMRMSP